MQNRVVGEEPGRTPGGKEARKEEQESRAHVPVDDVPRGTQVLEIVSVWRNKSLHRI